MIRLLHYSDTPNLAKIRSRAQSKQPAMKPNGFWVSVDDAWKEWCEGEEFSLDRLKYVYEVFLSDEAKILYIGTVQELDEFTEKYTDAAFEDGGLGKGIFIRWEDVAKEYEGIIIAPYLHERRFTRNTMWYYGWDVASGCIWKRDAIHAVLQYDDKGKVISQAC